MHLYTIYYTKHLCFSVYKWKGGVQEWSQCFCPDSTAPPHIGTCQCKWDPTRIGQNILFFLLTGWSVALVINQTQWNHNHLSFCSCCLILGVKKGCIIQYKHLMFLMYNSTQTQINVQVYVLHYSFFRLLPLFWAVFHLCAFILCFFCFPIERENVKTSRIRIGHTWRTL